MPHKKIIIFPGNFLPHMGGLETHVDQFSKYISRRGYDVTIFTPNTVEAADTETFHSSVKVIRYPAWEVVHNFPVANIFSLKFWHMFFSLYEDKFDVVMTRTMFFTNSTLGMFFAKFRFHRVKLVHVEHGSDFSKLDNPIKLIVNRLYMRTLGWLLLVLSDKIVAVSEAAKEFVQKKFINKKVVVIRRGFDFDAMESIHADTSLRKKYKNSLIVSFAGRLIDGKGVQDVLTALHTVKQDVIFVIMGEGEYRKQLTALVAKHKQSSRVVFLGECKHDKVISVFKASDIVVNPSYTEGLPTSVLDAFFCGAKIIATDVGGTKEILGDIWNKKYYALVDPKNPAQIAAAIDKLGRICDRVSKKELESVRKRFMWDYHAQQYDALLRQL